MAIFSKLMLGSAIFSSIALAAPFGPKAAWTVTETDYTVVDFTTTIYVDDSKTFLGGFQPTFAPHSMSASAPFEASSQSPSVVPSESAPTFAAPSTSMSAPVAPTATPASFSVSSTSTPPPATTPAAVISMPSTTTSAAAIIPATSTTMSSAAVIPTSSTTMSAPAATSSAALTNGGSTGGPASASDSATCQGEDAACQGDITWYPGGPDAACGVTVDPTGNGIALPFEFMGTLSNDNPYCGMSLTIYNPATGESAQAIVMDKCMGCVDRAIDLTPALFNAVSSNDQAAGRIHGVDWWFN